MSQAVLDPSTVTVPDLEQAIGIPQERWAKQCHVVSLAVVRSGIVGPARVARGAARGVLGQHSWVVLGNDCYDTSLPILDATLWSYVPQAPTIYVGDQQTWQHTPKGAGSIWQWGCPQSGGGEPIVLTPQTPLSTRAQQFLDTLGPLDHLGWATLASAPVLGWPAAEIVLAMHQTPTLSAFVPIDVLGMLTDVNPSGLYLPA